MHQHGDLVGRRQQPLEAFGRRSAESVDREPDPDEKDEESDDHERGHQRRFTREHGDAIDDSLEATYLPDRHTDAVFSVTG
ncbi:hypothetical protein LC1Hm_2362 [Halomicrobium sp. LC1Hm]|nr:hypothetical protein LC1Hm_2362 [Halomicrobium sp. LC1Hm]